MEPIPGSVRDLRPLGIGEVLDRAVTLCSRFFIPLALVYVVFAVPQGVIQFLAGRSLTQIIELFSAAVRRQAATGKPADPALLAHQLAAAPAPSGWLGVLWLLVFLVAPLALAALTEMTAADYLGRASSFGQAYRIALGRWLPLIGVNVIFLVAGIFAYVAVTLVLALLGFGVGLLYVFSHPLGLVLGIPLAIAVALAALAFAFVIVLALQVSYFTCVIETAPAVRSFATSLRRVFGRIGFPRALLFGAAYLAIVVGVVIVSFVGEATFSGLLHSDLAAAVYATLLRVASAVYLSAFVCVFYFDLRVLEEGFDLQLAAAEVLR